jgi:hypothetical protein
MPKTRLVSDDVIIAQYETLKSTVKVAVALGLGQSTVDRVLKKHGVKLDGLKRYREGMKDEPYTGVYQGSTDEILELYKSGLSMREIAKRIERSVHVVARRVRKAGIVRAFQGSGPEHSMWSGGRVDAGQGYFKIWVADDDPMAVMRNNHGYVLEHRLVVARKIGRPLRDTETVHHIDGDRTNNAPANLQLRQGKHGKHVVMMCLDCGSHNVGHAPLSN